MTQAFCTVALITLAACAQAQTAEPQPRIVTHEGMAGEVTVGRGGRALCHGHSASGGHIVGGCR